MGNIVVSCTSGRNIGELRDIIFDVASQVRENTGGYGRGCGFWGRSVLDGYHFPSRGCVIVPFLWLGVWLLCLSPPTVAGRGIGHGSRIAEYRLLMDQLVPASYLQLEDTVRNIALNMRLAGNPPVLTYKKLRSVQVKE